MTDPHPAMTQIESKVEPNRILDDFGRESISFVHFGIIHLAIIADYHLTWQYQTQLAP